MWLTLRSGAVRRQQPDQLHIGPFLFARLQSPTLAIALNDVEDPVTIAVLEGDNWRLISTMMPALDEFDGMTFWDVFIHDGDHRRFARYDHEPVVRLDARFAR